MASIKPAEVFCPHCSEAVVGRLGLAYNATFSPTTGEFNLDDGVYCNEEHPYAHRPEARERAEKDARVSR